MLALTVALLIAPAAQQPGPPPPPPFALPSADMPIMGAPPPLCDRVLEQVADRNGLTMTPGDRLVSGTDGLYRLTPEDEQPRVRMDHLLDRTVAGCPVPVIALDRVPGADRALGLELGRELGRRP